jgi:hypothetical protein
VSSQRAYVRTWPRNTRAQTEPDTARAGAAQMLRENSLLAAVYAPNPAVQRWIESELDRDGCMMQSARSIQGLTKALTLDPAPRPNLLIIDLDGIEPVELIALHELRQQGWFGSIIGVGHAPAALRTSLMIDQVLTPPLVQDQLRDAIAELRAPQPTVRLPVIKK